MHEKIKERWLPAITILLTAAILTGCRPQSTVNASNSTNGQIASNTSPENPRNPISKPDSAPINLVFVLDSSGSMAANVGAKSKMEIAKDVLGQLVDQLAPNVQVGLLAYGHRVKNDCHDTELLVPIGVINQGEFRRRVQSLQPLGQTPISYSVGHAAEALKDKAGKKIIILISDGEETCGGDPCALARELKGADIDLQIHVVGFNVDKEAARKQLSCIAQATGGQYHDAKDARELSAALQGAVDTSAKGEQVNGNKGKLLTESADSNGKQIEWSMEVFKAGTKEQILVTHTNPPPELPPGKYDVSYYNGNIVTGIVKRGIEIKGGQETRVEIEQSGRLVVKVLDQNGKEVNLVIKAHPTRDDLSWVVFHTSEKQELLPGIYDLEFWGGLEFWRKGIEIKAGQEVPLVITDRK